MNINMMIERLNGDGIPNYLYTLDDIYPVDKYYIGKIKGKWKSMSYVENLCEK